MPTTRTKLTTNELDRQYSIPKKFICPFCLNEALYVHTPSYYASVFARCIGRSLEPLNKLTTEHFTEDKMQQYVQCTCCKHKWKTSIKNMMYTNTHTFYPMDVHVLHLTRAQVEELSLPFRHKTATGLQCRWRLMYVAPPGAAGIHVHDEAKGEELRRCVASIRSRRRLTTLFKYNRNVVLTVPKYVIYGDPTQSASVKFDEKYIYTNFLRKCISPDWTEKITKRAIDMTNALRIPNGEETITLCTPTGMYYSTNLGK